ncbi:uncharacterized protein CCOS01_16431 [Colletotrichum costaricense]|uniref:Uncharacterized protein n=1 Tax=Colletotrichum costaricense TaxID=1209916 RepID=A0AAJ0DSL7_9PEZI|nr:uncharacterized protein CCOS01_16431 [Colletotrichum costaricense]KAK1506572.1 hypothetical protein CCOS01_16431 [Colletotrichum costaricense]
MIPHPPKLQGKAVHGSQSEAVADSTVPIPTADQVTLLQEEIERLEDVFVAQWFMHHGLLYWFAQSRDISTTTTISETEKAQPLAIGYAHTESAPLTNGNHSQPAETLLSLSNKGIAVGYGSKAEASGGFIIDPQPPYTATIARRSNATSTVAFAFVPSFRIPRTVDASSPPMPTNKTATWGTGVVDAVELKMRQDLGKSDSRRRGEQTIAGDGSHGTPSNPLDDDRQDNGAVERRDCSPSAAYPTDPPAGPSSGPIRPGFPSIAMSATNNNTICAANNIAGDDSNDSFEPPPQETSAVYSALAVSPWNAGLSPSPPPLISLSIPFPTP